MRDHMQSVHRRSVSEQSTFRQGVHNLIALNSIAYGQREEWANFCTVEDSSPSRFNLEELDAIDRFITAWQSGSFFIMCADSRDSQSLLTEHHGSQ